MSTLMRFTRFAALATLTATLSAQTFKKVATIDLKATGPFDYLTPSSADHRLYVAQDHQVVVVDTETNQVVGNITGLGHVHGVVFSADGKTGYISDGTQNKIHVFDTATLHITNDIATEGSNPDSQVIDPVTGHLFTFNGKSKEGVAIDLTTGKVIAHIPVPGKPEFSAADGAGHVFVNIEDTHQLLRIDTATNHVINRWLLNCEGPTGMTFDAADKLVFSACDGKAIATDDTNGQQIASINIGQGPDAIWFDPNTKLLFASNGDDGTLSIVRQNAKGHYTPLQTLKTGPGARTMAYNAITGRAYVIMPGVAKADSATSTKPLKVDVFAQ